MIEVLKQVLEALKDVGVLTDREWQAVHKNKANKLRQAIAELESQEPDKYEMDIECTKCGAKQSGVLTVNTHPPQRTEQNFCPRCGKRTNDIHTCTPPRDNT